MGCFVFCVLFGVSFIGFGGMAILLSASFTGGGIDHWSLFWTGVVLVLAGAVTTCYAFAEHHKDESRRPRKKRRIPEPLSDQVRDAQPPTGATAADDAPSTSD